jgi:cobalamin biosynthesis Mg chelatase CobN
MHGFGSRQTGDIQQSMAPEHEPDPLVAPRGDESDVDAGDSAAERYEEAAVEGPEREPIAEPRGSTEPESASSYAEPSAAATRSAERRNRAASPNMLPSRKGRGVLERTFVRVIATGGIVGICVAIAAIMSSSNSSGWIIGLVVSLVSVVLAALLWSSRIL